MINNSIHRPKWHQQSQIKAHKKSLKKSDKNPESTHNITETCKEYNKTTTESPYQIDKKSGRKRRTSEAGNWL
jgi:hypothetical protein